MTIIIVIVQINVHEIRWNSSIHHRGNYKNKNIMSSQSSLKNIVGSQNSSSKWEGNFCHEYNT